MKVNKERLELVIASIVGEHTHKAWNDLKTPIEERVRFTAISLFLGWNNGSEKDVELVREVMESLMMNEQLIFEDCSHWY